MELALFNKIVVGWTLLALALIPVQLKITAPYGRHSKTSWGPMIDNKLGWILQENQSLMLMVIFFFAFSLWNNVVITIFFSLWAVHYINRTFIFPFRMKTKGKKMPIFIMFSAIFFNSMNGFLNGFYFAKFGDYDISWLSDPRFIIGAVIFAAGFFINNQSDTILLNLRKPGETGYKIPQGGMFKFISCPNHFGEIIEWIGFACMVWSLPALSFAIWTAANLIPRAVAHHKWYKERFEDYPGNRKAVIPFVM